jgi:Domain of unknown function (DUF4062)
MSEVPSHRPREGLVIVGPGISGANFLYRDQEDDMKIFISSVIAGYEAYRAAAQQAVETLGHEVIRAEDFGASSASPRVACLSGVREADLVILLMGRRYGMRQQSGLSATHEEFEEARDRKEIVALVEQVTDREPEQAAFLNEVQDWQGGLFTEAFSDTEGLRRAVTRMLHERLLEDARGASDAGALRARVLSLLPREQRGYVSSETNLALALAGAPSQILLRPIQIEGPELDHQIFTLALQGPHAVFDRREGTEREIVYNTLVLQQPSRSVAVHSDGSIVLRLRMVSRSPMAAIIEEDVRDTIVQSLGFFNDLLSYLDPTGRIRHICIAANMLGADYAGWRTRDEDNRSPTSMVMNMDGRERDAIVTPAAPRAVLRTQRNEMGDDLTILLRRQFTRDRFGRRA